MAVGFSMLVALHTELSIVKFSVLEFHTNNKFSSNERPKLFFAFMNISMTLRKTLEKTPTVKSMLRRIYYRLRREPIIQDYDLSSRKIFEILGKDNPTILEVGCHDGETTVWFLEEFPSATIHCFDPDPRALEKFQRRIGADPRVHLHSCAIGAQQGRMKFHQSSSREDGQEWDASGSLMAPQNHLQEYPWVVFDEEIEVEVRTLDSVCDEHGIADIDLIWIDVQGAERLAILGGKRAFERARYIVTEYSNKQLYSGQPTMKDLLKLLSGHRVVARYPDDLLLERK
jgi:FkbM family methyltransferase